MISKILLAFLVFVQFNCYGQSVNDAISLIFTEVEAKNDQKELMKSLSKLNGKDKEIAQKLYVEYEYFILRIEGMEGLYHLYGLISEKEKESLRKAMQAKSNRYISRSNESLEVLISLQANSKSKQIIQGTEALSKHIKSTVLKVKQFNYE